MGELELRHTPDGVPFVRVDLGPDPLTGKRRRPRASFPGMIDDEALVAAREWYERITTGLMADALALYNTTKTEPNTRKTYDNYARRYAAPLAATPVCEVDVVMLNRLFMRLMREGADGRHPLKASTVNCFKQYLQGAFNFFVSEDMCGSNPVKESMRIQFYRTEGHGLDDASLSRLLRWLEGALTDTEGSVTRHNGAMAIWLALHTGIREGEACALRRQDVMIRQSTLAVNGNVVDTGGNPVRQDHTKGRKPRNITLTDDEKAQIRAHMAWQDGYLDTWGPQTPLLTVDGTFMRPRTISDCFRRVRAELGLSRDFHFHSLRHTNATMLLQDRVDPKTVQERLGHARAATTLEIYGHVMPGRDAVAAESINRSLEDLSH